MKQVVTPRQSSRLAGCLIAIGLLVLPTRPAAAANLVARWKLNEPGPAYTDSGPNAVPLAQDTATTTAITDAGVEGASAQLNWQSVPGVSTRLAAAGPSVQTDSFGFAFWLNANYLNDWDNLITKEMAYNNTVSNSLRVAWQVHLKAGVSGAAPLELVVRGDNRTQGSLFGSVVSTTNLPVHVSLADWIHVAGGYDAVTGDLRLYVNALESVSTNSTPGAHNSDGSAFSIGTARNGADFVAFSAGASIDDVQLYDGPLSASDAAWLKANPGQAIRTFAITTFSTAGNGDVTPMLSTSPGANYTIEAAAELAGFSAVTNFNAVIDYTTVTLSKAALDAVLGPAPRAKLFLRAQERVTPSGFEMCN